MSIREYQGRAIDCDIPDCDETYTDTVQIEEDLLIGFAVRDGWHRFARGGAVTKDVCPGCCKNKPVMQILFPQDAKPAEKAHDVPA